MIDRKFYIQIIIRITAIVGLSIFMTLNAFRYEKLFTVLACAFGIVFLMFDMLRLTNKFNRDLLSFFEALKYEDHSFGLKKISVPGFKKMSAYMNELNEQLSKVKIENEIQAQYLNTIIEHIQVGLLALHPSGRVEFVNSAAQKILSIHKISHLNAILEKYPHFGNILKNLQPGAQKLVKLETEEGIYQLSLRSSSFRSKEEMVHLYSFQNIETEVEETELETWKKLIRVLTHEINNSITPIHSLSDSLRQMIQKKPPEEYTESTDSKVAEGLCIIQERSLSLLDFVEKFRSLTPKGNLQKESFAVDELLYKLKLLMKEYYAQNSPIKIETHVTPHNLKITADQKYIEQILINLIKNAIEALEDSPEGRIRLKAFMQNGNPSIQVIDNGAGIPKEEMDRIFIPFYTTKKSGSGIGLSLSRQIMKMHGGSISAQSELHRGSVFTLRF